MDYGGFRGLPSSRVVIRRRNKCVSRTASHYVRRLLGVSKRSSVSPGSHEDVAGGTLIARSEDFTLFPLQPSETSALTGRSQRRCPYCVHEGQFRSMSIGTYGQYVCDNCGHIAVLTDPAFKCYCRKCLEIHKFLPIGARARIR
jgi:hypothetical protein